MINFLRHTIIFLLTLTTFVARAEPVKLSTDTYNAEMGVAIIHVNWGRVWKCGKFENAQLEALNFTKTPIDSQDVTVLNLETPSKLNVANKYLAYAFVIQPGQYFLTGFDVKVAHSVTDVAHMNGGKESLIKDGVPLGGMFTVNPGEIVYIGHFGLECGAEPFLWRYFIEDQNDFGKYVEGFRKEFPFVKQVPVQYRIFSTKLFGNPSDLESKTVN